MRRFATLGLIFSALTLVLGYQAVRSMIHGVEAVIGIGMPRLVLPGLMNLGLGALSFYLATLTLRLARQYTTLIRLTSRRPRV